jgi:hypothetical protein
MLSVREWMLSTVVHAAGADEYMDIVVGAHVLV